MPLRAPTPCCKCGQLRCTSHDPKSAAHEYDVLRKRKENNPLVSLYKCKRWIITRLQILARDPVCMECRNALSVHCDHKIDARVWVSSGRDFYDQQNLQGLCQSCHSSKTAREREIN